MASPSYSFLYRLVLSDRLARRTTFLKGERGMLEPASGHQMHEHVWEPLAAQPLTYPRLPALDVLRLKDDLCLSCDFMITSCLCFSSNSRTLNSSSSHRSEMAEESVVGGPPGQRSYHPNPPKTPSILWDTQKGEKTMPALFPGLQPNL